jgi:formamidopyrimidine-DNA glycosylase
MTDKSTGIIAAIKACLIKAGINYVYTYPDTKQGQNFPMAVIAERDREMVSGVGNTVHIEQLFSVIISINTLTDRATQMAKLEAAVWTELLRDIKLGGDRKSVV